MHNFFIFSLLFIIVKAFQGSNNINEVNSALNAAINTGNSDIISAINALNNAIDSQAKKCCQSKIVDGISYTFSHHGSTEQMLTFKCSDKCMYTNDNTGELFCFKPGNFSAKCSSSNDAGENVDSSLQHSSSISLVEKTKSCMQTSFNCVGDDNVLSSTNTTTLLSECDAFCNNVIGCKYWSFDQEELICSALSNCAGKKQNDILSGTPKCVSEDYVDIEQGGKILLVKDCLQFDTACKGSNSTFKVENVHECAQMCEMNSFCRSFTYNNLSNQECYLFYDHFPETSTKAGMISGDKDCASYRENFGASKSCGLTCSVRLARYSLSCHKKVGFGSATKFVKCVFGKLKGSKCHKCACSYLCKKHPTFCKVLQTLEACPKN